MNRIHLNNDWFFTPRFTDELVAAGADMTGLTPVRLPHSVADMPLHHFDEQIYQMVSGYKRIISIKDEWRDSHLLLTFEGAAHEATVYINGNKVVRNTCGYTAFTVDMKDYLAQGPDQVILVRLDSRETLDQPPFGGKIDYMTFGGLYREVYLDIKPACYIDNIYAVTPGTYVEDPQLKVDVTVNAFTPGLSIGARLALWRGEAQDTPADVESEDPDNPAETGDHGEPVQIAAEVSAGEEPVTEEVSAGAGEDEPEAEYAIRENWEFDDEEVRFATSCLTYDVPGVLPWDTVLPFLYTLTVELKFNGRVIDTCKMRVGFREIFFDSDGFYLNGEKLLLRGLNRHQSYPYVGYAMPRSLQQLDADILKYELGCNVVRTSHYPQSQAFLDRCDEIGLLVITEIPGWQHIGGPRWKNIAVKNTKDMVMQYRHHPSIILWGVRINESDNEDALYHKTNQAAHTLDLYRQTGGVHFHKQRRLQEDVNTFNDFSHNGTNEGCLPKSDIVHAGQDPYMITEYCGHMYPTKMWDDEAHRLNHALRHAAVVNAAEDRSDEGIAGATGWCFADYNTHAQFGSGDRICYHGVMDMFRNPKMAAAVYKSQAEYEPVLEVATDMNSGELPECIIGDIYVFTNCDSVLLYKDDELIGEYLPDETQYGSMLHPPVIITGLQGEQVKPSEPARWRFEGVKDGQIVISKIKTPGSSIFYKFFADKRELVEAETYDAAAIHIEAVDENDNHIYTAMDPMILSAEGAIELIGPSMISLQGGYGGAYVKSTGRPGEGRLIIRSLKGETVIEFTVVERKPAE